MFTSLSAKKRNAGLNAAPLASCCFSLTAPRAALQIAEPRRLQEDVACPAGTAVAYADENLGFRFHSDDITHDAGDGSLRWEAAVPAGAGLAFTMTRPEDEQAYTLFSSTRSSTAPTPDYSQARRPDLTCRPGLMLPNLRQIVSWLFHALV